MDFVSPLSYCFVDIRSCERHIKSIFYVLDVIEKGKFRSKLLALVFLFPRPVIGSKYNCTLLHHQGPLLTLNRGLKRKEWHSIIVVEVVLPQVSAEPGRTCMTTVAEAIIPNTSWRLGRKAQARKSTTATGSGGASRAESSRLEVHG